MQAVVRSRSIQGPIIRQVWLFWSDAISALATPEEPPAHADVVRSDIEAYASL